MSTDEPVRPIPAPPPPPPRSQAGGAPAQIWERVVGSFIDGIVLIPISIPLFWIHGRIGILLSLIVHMAYEVTLTSRTGQTIGKRVVHTKVVMVDTGAVPTEAQATIRWFVRSGLAQAIVLVITMRWLGLYPLVVFLTMLQPPDYRGIHDRAAGTVVLSTRYR